MKAVLEGLLFLSGDEGLSLKEIKDITELSEEEIKKLIKELYEDYSSDERGINIEYLGERFKLTTKPIHKEYYKKLVKDDYESTLSDSALEVLAIIAYNMPITRIDIDSIRGVNSTYVLRKLMIKGLIEESGRAELPGRPRLYKVSNRFLDYFGLGDISELPKVEFKEETNDEDKDLFESKYTEEE